MDCPRAEFCGVMCWVGPCGHQHVPEGIEGHFCQPCTECIFDGDSITAECSYCYGPPFGECKRHSQCAPGQFCGRECWTGGCGLYEDVGGGVEGNFCQPCREC